MRRQCRSSCNTIIRSKKQNIASCKNKPDSVEKGIYDDIIYPYKENGMLGLPGMSMFMKYCKLLDTKHKKTKCMHFKLYDEFLSMIWNNKTLHLNNLKLEKENNTLLNHNKEALATIKSLKKEELTNRFNLTGSTVGGSMKIVMNTLTPLIYAEALINLEYAWYHYLYPGVCIEPKKLIATCEYVASLGDSAYSTLIDALDQKFYSLERNIAEMEEDITKSLAYNNSK